MNIQSLKNAMDITNNMSDKTYKLNINSSNIYTDKIFDDLEILYFTKYNVYPSLYKTKITPTVTEKIIPLLEEHEFELLRTDEDVRYTENAKTIYGSDKLNILLGISKYPKAKPDPFDDVEEDIEKCNHFEIIYDCNTISNNDFLKSVKDIITLFESIAEKKNIIHFLEKQDNTLIATPHQVHCFDVQLQKHYNDGFEEIDEKIRSWMTSTDPNKKLVLLNGEPGTGKTNYIKHLLNHKTNNKKIYIPPYYITALTDPAFFSFIKNYSGSTIIIEDAEKILMSREQQGENSAISILLNLCDGILANVLDFKLIVSFNTDEKNIDKALLRKGRLFLKYKFDKLSKEKTHNLYQELYSKNPPEDEMTIANIYNVEDNGESEKEEKKMGFL